eukprot:12255140-Alexandrium_andersonii.AAC.1
MPTPTVQQSVLRAPPWTLASGGQAGGESVDRKKEGKGPGAKAKVAQALEQARARAGEEPAMEVELEGGLEAKRKQVDARIKSLRGAFAALVNGGDQDSTDLDYLASRIIELERKREELRPPEAQLQSALDAQKRAARKREDCQRKKDELETQLAKAGKELEEAVAAEVEAAKVLEKARAVVAKVACLSQEEEQEELGEHGKAMRDVLASVRSLSEGCMGDE